MTLARSAFAIGITLALIGPRAHAQTFGEAVLFDSDSSSLVDADFVDMDGDGDLDLLSAYSANDQISWAENMGAGVFAGQRNVGFDPIGGGTESVRGADLDGDGDTDVLTTRFSVWTADPVGWYENLGGEVFGPYQLLASNPASASLGRLGDLDGDGDVDVIVAGDRRHPTLYDNTGGGSFSPGVQLGTWTADATAMEIVDLDGDGLLDVVWAVGLSNRVLWVRNLGNGLFSSTLTVAAAISNPRDMAAHDLDADGDVDLVIASTVAGSVVWLENLGGATFGPKQFISTATSNVRKVAIGDIDNDGDADVFSGSVGETGFAWHQNLTGNIFAPVSVLSADSNAWVRLLTSDVDQDGDVDPVVVADRALWSENDGAGGFGSMQGVVSRVPGGAPVDFDFDGDTDFLAVSHASGEVLLARNSGGLAFEAQELLVDDLDDVLDSRALDLDGDGDLDLVSSGGSFGSTSAWVRWHENQNGVFVIQPNMYQVFADSGAIFQVADLEADGDMDFFVTHLTGFSTSHTTMSWIRNDGGGVFTSLPGMILFRAGFIYPSDLDGDGDQDIVAENWTGPNREISWFENLGGGMFGPAVILALYPQTALAWMEPGDADGDGDVDVFVLDRVSDEIDVVVNQGSGTFAAPVLLASLGLEATTFLAKDLDLDGDLDPVGFASNGEGEWFENLGNGNWAPGQPVPLNAGSWVMGSGTAVDLNGDSDLDFVRYTSLGMVLQSNDLRFGDAYCGPVVEHSGGSIARISSSGSSVAADNNFALLADQMPSAQFGFFLVASDSGFVAMPAASQGNLCVGGQIGRMNRGPAEIFGTGASGSASVGLDLMNVPTPTGVETMTAGTVRFFQAWFRDSNPTATSNFTGGLRVEFQ